MKVLDFYIDYVLPVILLVCLLFCYVALGILVFTKELNWLEVVEVSVIVLFSPMLFEISKTLLKDIKVGWRNKP